VVREASSKQSQPSDQAEAASQGGPPGQQGAAAGAPSDSNGVEAIVVSATRRATDLQVTPVSVSAITAKQLSTYAPHDLGSLAAFVPNFSAANVNGFNAASFAMRGIGQTTIIVYYDSPVAVLVDDFVVPSVQTQLLDTFDTEQIEVLRGPQGTLFGKNTTGGAVSVHTKLPELGAFLSEGQAGYGSFGTYYIKGAVNVPLNEALAFRLAVADDQSDGYYKNGAAFGPIHPLTRTTVVGPSIKPFLGATGRGNGESIGGEDVVNGRAKLLWKPNGVFQAVLQGEVLRDHSDTVPAVNLSPAGVRWPTFGLPGQFGGNPLDSASVNTADTILDLKHSSVDVTGGYLNANWNVGVGTITEVAGYRTQESRLPFTNGGTPAIVAGGQSLNVFDARREDDHDTAQQELRFASQLSGPINFVGGLFYQYDTIDFCVDSIQAFQDLSGSHTPFGPFNTNPRITCSEQWSTSYAGYAEGTYDVNSKLKLIAGVRETNDDKIWKGRQLRYAQQLDPANPSLTYHQLGGLLNASVDNYPAGVVRVEKDWTVPTWRLGTSYQVSDQVFSYATFSRGYKAGGFNDQIGNGGQFGSNLSAFAAAAAPTNPEYANSLEVGLKTELFDRRLRLNGTVFWVRYTDLQRQVVVPLSCCGLPAPIQTTLFLNAASADVKGFEGELEARVTERLTLRSVLGYQDGKFNQYTAPGAKYNLANNPMDRTPRWSATLDGIYDVPVSDWGRLTLDANAEFVDTNIYSISLTNPAQNTYLDARTLFNASAALANSARTYYGKLIGRNLADRRYQESNIIAAGLYATGQYGPPRYFGIEFGFNF
jgi:iron complex outermembrane receptor protein